MRIFIQHYVASAEDAVNGFMASAFRLERSFTSTVASLAPDPATGERLMPGLVYVLVAAMGGSILSRRRGIVLRAVAPTALGVGAGWVVIPHTMRNVGDLVWEGEKKVPGLAEGHQQLRDGIESGVRWGRTHLGLGLRTVDAKVGETRDAIEWWVRKGK